MGRVISVRLNKYLEEIIERFSEERKEEQSDLVRDLIKNGGIYMAIKIYAKGKISIGKAAFLANMPISEFVDLLSELEIKSKISREDLLDDYEKLKNIF